MIQLKMSIYKALLGKFPRRSPLSLDTLGEEVRGGAPFCHSGAAEEGFDAVVVGRGPHS